ncbi:nickel-type superoxide dismutase maturation protease [Actinomadura sp. NTSP31]|uniref:nickel-type superoxide dismutase maturation protease n=1 Tax=Actinomadura sp. NTSP31 TaxID=1735447 RepID=UPI0035C187B5
MRMRHPVAWTLGGAVLLALAGTRGRLRTVAVTGDSMLPGLAPGDWLVVLAGARPRPGDVVVARHPERADVLIVKRVAHRSGDGWWLESDNQRARGRRDSWDFGAVPDRRVLGRVVARYWPWRRVSVRPGAGRPADGR